MDHRITLIGLNHRTAGVDLRERYSLDDCVDTLAWPLPAASPARESLILSTCNRVEILTVSDCEIEDHLFQAWAAACGRPADEIRGYAYNFRDAEAIRHVFNVAASLDSMIIGEPQILGQLKAAYRRAAEGGHTAAILNRLMHAAFHTAKRVRHETAIASNAVSVSYAAVELAKRIFGAMPGHKAMLIGAGEMAELAARHLLRAGIDELIIANRTFATGQALAARFSGRPIGMAEIGENLRHADIVIASTGSKEPLLDAEKVGRALKARKNRPMFFIDIAVPRDIDPAVNALDNVYLYDIDDLKDVVEENVSARQEEAKRAKAIIDAEVVAFLAWLESLDARPVILNLIKRGEDACAAELARALKQAGPVSPAVRSAMERLALGVAKRMNHDPIMYLKSGAGETAPGRIAQIRQIFNLDDRCS